MAFRWQDYLVLARALASESTESAHRTAISRSYYAVLISTRNKLRGRGKLQSGLSSHDAIWSSCDSDGAWTPLGSLGRKLRTRRTHADYDDALSGRSDQLAKEALEISTRALEMLDRL